ncbi:hypothetical protein BBP00_00004707 [Phytophthora kernoviae]|uniref:Kinesin motor domain-containing protein n=1 Tax=Phytophthora kernoviae TaxID=325452 RepID=A0A3F2RST1_9STRA|nr:hypothetical protein BBP00_00004707 [Phytophthora kernoviae]
MAEARASARELTTELRSSVAALKRDVATSFRLCGRDFHVLGGELVGALERGRGRERAAADALAHERSARGKLEARLAELQGTIRVLCRVRPLMTGGGSSGGDESDVASPDRRRKRIQVESSHELSVFSPRLSKTAETPAVTVRESQHINKSLAAIGDVLAALLAKEKHIPFRNSKLTHLLQDSLGGSANRTLLLVHVSPTSADVSETINSLKFASRVSYAQTGKSQRTERTEISRLNGVIANQASQLHALQEKLTAELEQRKKYEKRLQEYRQEEHRRKAKGDEAKKLLLLQNRTPSPPELPPPISSRRWSLYTRKEKLVNNSLGLNVS